MSLKALSDSSRDTLGLPLPISGLLLLVLGPFALVVFAIMYWITKSRRNRRRPEYGVPINAVLDDGFSMHHVDGGSSIHFEIRGSGIGLGAWFGLLFTGLLLGGVAAIFAGLNGFIATLVIFTAIALVWDRARKMLYEFVVTETAIQVPNGKEYAKSEISELLIRNQIGKTVHARQVEWTQSSTVIIGTGVTGAAMAGAAAINNVANSLGRLGGQMGAEAGAAIQNSLTLRGNEVAIRFGRNVVPLAKYLQEDDAIALFNKVREVV